MTFTYVEPPATAKDRVRYWSGDVLEIPQSESDEGIQFLLSVDVTNGNEVAAAAAVCRRIGDRMMAKAATSRKSVGPTLVIQDYAAVAKSWYDRADRLNSGGFLGGFAISGALWTGAAAPVFKVAMQDNGTVVPELGQ